MAEGLHEHRFCRTGSRLSERLSIWQIIVVQQKVKIDTQRE